MIIVAIPVTVLLFHNQSSYLQESGIHLFSALRLASPLGGTVQYSSVTTG